MINVNLNFGRGHEEAGKFMYHFNEQVYDLMKDYLRDYVGKGLSELGHLQAFTGVNAEPTARDIYQMWGKYVDHLSSLMNHVFDEAGIISDSDLSRYQKHDMRKLHRILDRYTLGRFKEKKETPGQIQE